jgi:hypothetical protein
MSGPLEKRKFFIIAHNPNTIADAKAYLLAGANALEPDICVSNGTFFVSHDHSAFSNPFDDAHSLVTYLTELRRFVIAEGKKINLALILWDYKDPEANVGINSFLQIVHDNFSKFPQCSDIAMGVTVSSKDHADFLTKYTGGITNVGVGVDEEKVPADVSAAFAAGQQKRYSYANGIITTGIKLGVFHSMLAAKAVQATDKAMKLIYTWVMADKDSMRDFLHIHIDGIIVNLGTVPSLKALLLEKDFVPIYELAMKGYNPWNAPALPTYYAEIHTADTYLAGTDAMIRFDLTGTGGTLTTTLNSDYKDILEQAATNTITFEGLNIGTVTSLKLTATTSDINSDWLPQMIEVTSNNDSDQAFFNYGPNDWLKKNVPMTRQAQAAP